MLTIAFIALAVIVAAFFVAKFTARGNADYASGLVPEYVRIARQANTWKPAR